MPVGHACLSKRSEAERYHFYSQRKDPQAELEHQKDPLLMSCSHYKCIQGVTRYVDGKWTQSVLDLRLLRVSHEVNQQATKSFLLYQHNFLQ